jgi:hypothetical protein
MRNADDLLLDSTHGSRSKPIHLNRELRQLGAIAQSNSVQNIITQSSYNADNSRFIDLVHSEQHDLNPK